ncbi:MAG: hypothetical protein OXC69_08425 [Candidatus Tectomicrobia bacterium]|nr:hypothetical protein [Candidatus Tectomicrobia bacterium]
MAKQSSSDSSGASPHNPKGGATQPTRTPLYQANHDARYQRQTLIKKINSETNRSLICYVSGGGDQCMIDGEDIVPFVDLLHNVPEGQSLDLLLHTTGGSIDAAEKLMGMLRNHVRTAELRIIVPDFAKSAGTLMVLGADSVIMSSMSELGPIDPQEPLFGRWQSVQNYVDAYKTYEEALQTNPNNMAARIMIGKLDPTTMKYCEAAMNRSRQAAEDLLKRGMFRNGGNWTQTVSELLDTQRWRSHNQVITWEDARDPHLGLAVEYLEYHSEEWQDYWRVYCLQKLAVGRQQKLYESDYASLIIGPPGGD